MLAIGIDWSDAKRVMGNLKAAEDQMPFAMSLALNAATEKARQHLITSTWSPTHGIKVRNKAFISAILPKGKVTWALKRELSTEITENPSMQGRGNLWLHAHGGIRRPKKQTFLAIPSSNIPKGPRGVPARLKPKAIQGSRDKVQKGDVLYMREKKSGRLKLLYVLKTSTRIPKRVPFFEDYKMVMSRELHKALPIAVERAMRTRRAR